ncbi:DUF3862 domain-containing protein [Paenibacillus xerothermodurans]|uniref:DUF3862 domain-containing protein n=1 Tax=Paenibacillus xerothermodurans TaxID=1977292 RepID=A0A2W1NBM9_PAEXE|nr:DUF3862 domain-containing protein [Paenibacillus xerothermodurans]PZE20501.1 DUF3862 domain-containing protein [Paenibacillus xerothermodurans]
MNYAVILLMLGLMACADGEITHQKESITDPRKMEPNVYPPVPRPVDKHNKLMRDRLITKQEFDLLQLGMSYQEVTQIVGGPGQFHSVIGQRGTPNYTEVYIFDGLDSDLVKVQLTFKDGKLYEKIKDGQK